MKALIVEDEIYNFEALKRMVIRAYSHAEIVGPITNIIDLEKAMTHQSDFDVVYCDIQLEDGQCFGALDKTEITVPIIFTTAYSEFALKAFEANGIAYLLKPVKADALAKATEKALSMGRGKQDIAAMLESIGLKERATYLHYLRANTFDGSYIVDVANVNHFTTDGKKTYAMMQDGAKHRIDYTLEQLMQRLDPILFFRANRQYIVNRRAIHRIQAYGNRQMQLKLMGYDGTQVLVSKENATTLNNWIEQ